MINPCGGVSEGTSHHIFCGIGSYTKVSKKDLPIFRPNEYFWKHHQKEGEEKCDTYRRVI